MDLKLSVFEVSINDRNSFLDLQNSWNTALNLNKAQIPFLSFEWTDLWLSNFLSTQPIKVLFLKDKQQISAISTFFKNQLKLGKFNLNCFQLPANAHSNRSDFLIGSKTESHYQAILEFLFDKDQELDGLFLPLIPDSSPSINILEKISQDNNFLFASRPGITSPSVVLPDSWDNYLLSLSKKTRYELKKREKNWESLSGKKEVYFVDESNVEQLIDSIQTIEMNSWKAKEQRHLLVNNQVWEFYKQLIKRFAKLQLLHAIVLSVNNVPAAYELAIIYENILYSLKTSFNEIFQKLNCGYVLRAKMLKRAFELGLAENDLLGDIEPWKQHFANKYQKHFYVYLLKNNFMNRIIWETEFALRPIAGKIKRKLVMP